MTAPLDPEDPHPGFDVVRRGYAREQVESHVEELRRRLVAAENARRMAEQHAAAAADELAVARDRSHAATAPATPETFGARAERVLRLAEREASEIRSRATHQAAALLEEAHRAAGEARAVADRERAAAQRAREQMRTLDDDVAVRTRELYALRTALRAELARLHGALGNELRQLDGEIRLQQPAVPEQRTPAAAATPPAPAEGPGTGPERSTAETGPAGSVPQDTDPVPADPAPSVPAPSVPAPSDSAPAEPASADSAPFVPASAEPASAEPAPGTVPPTEVDAAEPTEAGTRVDSSDPAGAGSAPAEEAEDPQVEDVPEPAGADVTVQHPGDPGREDSGWSVPGQPSRSAADAADRSTDTGPIPLVTPADETPADEPPADGTPADDGETGANRDRETVDLFAEGPRPAEITSRIPLPRPHGERSEQAQKPEQTQKSDQADDHLDPGRHAFRT